MRKIKNICTSVRTIFRFPQRCSFLFLIRLKKKIFQEMGREIFKECLLKVLCPRNIETFLTFIYEKFSFVLQFK